MNLLLSASYYDSETDFEAEFQAYYDTATDEFSDFEFKSITNCEDNTELSEDDELVKKWLEDNSDVFCDELSKDIDRAAEDDHYEYGEYLNMR